MIIRKVIAEAKPLIKIIKKEAENVTTSPLKITPIQTPKAQITIKPTAAQSMFEEGVGANIIAEQNKARIIIRPKTAQTVTKPTNRIEVPEQVQSTTSPITIRRRNSGYISPYHSDYERLCNTGIAGSEMTPEKATELQQKFFEETGLMLHVPASSTRKFSIALDTICSAVHEGTFPKDIKHVLIGHGYGSSTAKTWALEGKGLKDGKLVEVFPYINANIPKGEKVLVTSCESHCGQIASKPGIGNEVQLSLEDLSAPGKVVRSGIDRIIGHYTKTGGFVPYEMAIKPKV